MLNGIWVAMVLIAVWCGAATGRLEQVTTGSVKWAGEAVTIAIGLVGIMTLWMGLMRVLQEGGLLRAVARGLGPIMRRLFPDVPADHPAMSMMILNFTANMLGLANAATPFGLKAMAELNKLNQRPGIATNAMIMFLSINATNLALLPTGIISLRTSLGSKAPGSIILTTLIATTASTLTAATLAWFFNRSRYFAPADAPAVTDVAVSAPIEADTREAEAAINKQVVGISGLAAKAGLAALVGVTLAAFVAAVWGDAVSLGWGAALQRFVASYLLLVLMVLIIAYGIWKNVKIYDAVVTGGKEGFNVALRIIPYLVAMLAAVGMLRDSGGIDMMAQVLDPITGLVGMPAETLPMALLRPLTGNGAYGVAASIMKTHGPDSLIGNIVSTMQGSTETTFYVLALYFGVAGVRRTRHTLICCLAGDVMGALMAVWACRWLLT